MRFTSMHAIGLLALSMLGSAPMAAGAPNPAVARFGNGDALAYPGAAAAIAARNPADDGQDASNNAVFTNSIAINAESALFARQYIATLKSSSDRLETCYNFYDRSIQRFEDAGMDYLAIVNIWCADGVKVKPVLSDELDPIRQNATRVFTRRAFKAGGDGKTTSRVYSSNMCDYLDSGLLSEMGLTNGPIQKLCSEDDRKVPSKKTGAVLSDDVKSSLREWRSTKFGLIKLISAKDTEAIRPWCQDLSNETVKSAFTTLWLDVNVIKDTVCKYVDNGPPAISELVPQAKDVMSKIFATQLLHASQEDNYQNFICKNIKDSGLARTSLDASVVRSIVCKE